MGDNRGQADVQLVGNFFIDESTNLQSVDYTRALNIESYLLLKYDETHKDVPTLIVDESVAVLAD